MPDHLDDGVVELLAELERTPLDRHQVAQRRLVLGVESG
jgi:hypothetical protein